MIVLQAQIYIVVNTIDSDFNYFLYSLFYLLTRAKITFETAFTLVYFQRNGEIKKLLEQYDALEFQVLNKN